MIVRIKGTKSIAKKRDTERIVTNSKSIDNREQRSTTYCDKQSIQRSIKSIS